MKLLCKAVLIVLIIVSVNLQLPGPAESLGISKDKIIENSWKAMFGELTNNQVRSIYVEGFFHGSKIPSRITIKRPDKFRNEMQSGVLVFNGKRAAWVKRSPDNEGNPRNPEMINPAHWLHYEVDMGLIFPAFFDHDSEFRGIKKQDGKHYYEIFVTLPLGGAIAYLIDTKDFLIKRRFVSWEGEAEGKAWENIIDHYIEYNGIRYPDGYSFMGRDGMEKGYYKNFKLNINPGEQFFLIPEELK